jgi:hypothetical protein
VSGARDSSIPDDLNDDFYAIDDDDEIMDMTKLKPKATEARQVTSSNSSGDHLMDNAIRMIKSKSVVFVLSRFAINNHVNGSSLELIQPHDSINQLLFEMRLAIELRNLDLLENGISVVLVGDVDDDAADGGGVAKSFTRESSSLKLDEVHYKLYFTHYEGELVGRYGSCHPESLPTFPVTSIEVKTSQCLDAQSLGSPTIPDGLSVSDVVSEIISYPNYMLSGRGDAAWADVAHDVHAWFTDRMPDFPRGSSGGAGGDAHFDLRTGAERVRDGRRWLGHVLWLWRNAFL